MENLLYHTKKIHEYEEGISTAMDSVVVFLLLLYSVVVVTLKGFLKQNLNLLQIYFLSKYSMEGRNESQ